MVRRRAEDVMTLQIFSFAAALVSALLIEARRPLILPKKDISRHYYDTFDVSVKLQFGRLTLRVPRVDVPENSLLNQYQISCHSIDTN